MTSNTNIILNTQIQEGIKISDLKLNKVQNFRSLLNKPEESSFLKDISSYFYYENNELDEKKLKKEMNELSQKEEPVSLDNSINLNFSTINDKSYIIPTKQSYFSYLNSDVNQHTLKSQDNASHLGNNNASNLIQFNRNFKQLCKDDYSDYIESFILNYPTFKKNHYNKEDFKSNTFLYSVSFDIDNSSCNNYDDTFYHSTNAINKINKDFFVEHEKYKILSNYFNLSLDQLNSLIIELMNSSSYLENEVLMILQHSSKIFNYICDNLAIYDVIEGSYMKLNQIKNNNHVFKQAYIDNTMTMLRLNIKKRNINKLKSHIILLKKLKVCSECLNTLSRSASKYQLVINLVNKSNELISKAREITGNSKSLKCILFFEKEFIKYTSNSSDKAIDELVILLKISFTSLKTSSAIDDMLFIINNIKTKTKLKEIFCLILKLDIEFYSKIKQTFSKLLIDSLDCIIVKSKDVERVSIEDYIKVISIIKDFSLMIKSMLLEFLEEYLSNSLLGETNINKKIINHKDNYDIEFDNSIRLFTEDGINKLVEFSKEVFECLDKTDLDKYFIRENELSKAIENYIGKYSESKDFNYMIINEACSNLSIIKQEIRKTVIKNVFTNIESSLTEAINKEDFSILIDGNEIKKNNKRVNKLLTLDISRFSHDTTECLDYLNKIEDDTTDNNEVKDKLLEEESQYILIKNKRLKCINSFNITIDAYYKFIKLAIICSDSLESLISSFSKILKTMIYLKKDLILEGKGVGINFQKINQSHILALSSDVNLIGNLLAEVINLFPQDEIINDYYSEFKISIDCVTQDLKLSLFELYKDLVIASISLLCNIDFSQYPIPPENTINKHIRVIHSLLNLYKDSCYCLEKYDLNDFFKDLFKLLFDGYDKIIISASKMENEICQLQ